MPDTSSTARFGPFAADLTTGELFRDGVRVPLQQQPFRLLRVLVDRRGELVTRAELRRALWPDGTFVEFERGLTSAMRKLREALGDRADRPRYIETLPGRGYRFIAEAHTGPIGRGRRSFIKIPYVSRMLAATLLAGAVVGFGAARLLERSMPPDAARASVDARAERLVRLRAATTNEWAWAAFAEGERLADRRTEPALRRAAASYALARALDGSFAEAWAAEAEMIATLAWMDFAPRKQSYDRALALAGEALERAPNSARARMVRGLVRLGRDVDPEGAARDLAESLVLDPSLVPAYSIYACVLRGQRRFDAAVGVMQRARTVAPRSARVTAELGLALHAAKRYDEEWVELTAATGLEPESPDAWLQLGLGYTRRREYAAAEQALRRALALSGESPRVLYWIGFLYAESGRLDEARRTLNHLTRLASDRYVPPAIIQSLSGMTRPVGRG